MKYILLFLLLFTEGVMCGQIPEVTNVGCNANAEIVGNAGIVKVTCSPNDIAELQVIDQRFAASFAWDTLNNVLYRYIFNNPPLQKWVNYDRYNISMSYPLNTIVTRTTQSYVNITVLGARKGNRVVCDQIAKIGDWSGSSTSFSIISGTVIDTNLVQIQVSAFGTNQLITSLNFTVYP
jgi:hypothetical protein